MGRLNRTLKAIAAAAMTFSLACMSVPMTASAETAMSFLQGDINGDVLYQQQT